MVKEKEIQFEDKRNHGLKILNRVDPSLDEPTKSKLSLDDFDNYAITERDDSYGIIIAWDGDFDVYNTVTYRVRFCEEED